MKAKKPILRKAHEYVAVYQLFASTVDDDEWMIAQLQKALGVWYKENGTKLKLPLEGFVKSNVLSGREYIYLIKSNLKTKTVTISHPESDEAVYWCSKTKAEFFQLIYENEVGFDFDLDELEELEEVLPC